MIQFPRVEGGYADFFEFTIIFKLGMYWPTEINITIFLTEINFVQICFPNFKKIVIKQ